MKKAKKISYEKKIEILTDWLNSKAVHGNKVARHLEVERRVLYLHQYNGSGKYFERYTSNFVWYVKYVGKKEMTFLEAEKNGMLDSALAWAAK